MCVVRVARPRGTAARWVFVVTSRRELDAPPSVDPAVHGVVLRQLLALARARLADATHHFSRGIGVAGLLAQWPLHVSAGDCGGQCHKLLPGL